jgi:hypothetical protein
MEHLYRVIGIASGSYLLPRFQAAVDSGLSVEFGDVGLSRQGIHWGPHLLAWSDIDRINLEDGLHIESKKAGALNIWNLKRFSIRNEWVFQILADRQLRKAADGPPAPSWLVAAKAAGRKPSFATRALACTLASALIISLCVPGGLIHSAVLAWCKGRCVCAEPGCMSAGAVPRPVQEARRFRFVTRVYCEEHAAVIPKPIEDFTQIVPLLIAVFGAGYLVVYACMFIRVMTDALGPGPTVKGLAVLTIMGFILECASWAGARYLC